MLQFLLNEQRTWLGLEAIQGNSLRTSERTLMPNGEDVANYCIQGSSIRINIGRISHAITFPKIPIALYIDISSEEGDDDGYGWTGDWDPYELFSCTVLFEDSSMRTKNCLYRSLYCGGGSYTNTDVDSTTVELACDIFLVWGDRVKWLFFQTPDSSVIEECYNFSSTMKGWV